MKLRFIKKLSNSGMLPITLDEVKTYIRITHDYDDTVLQDIMYAVCQIFQQYTGISVTEELWEVGYTNVGRYIFTLPVKPVVRIIEVATNDNWTKESIEKEDYYIDSNDLVLSYIPNYRYITVRCIAGYKKDEVNSYLKQCLLQHAGHLYEKRDDSFDLNTYDLFKNYRI